MSSKFVNQVPQRLRGTGRFLFALGATQATAATAGYRDLGNVVDNTLTPSSETFDDVSMIGGQKIPEDKQYLRQALDFGIKLNELDQQNLALMLRSRGGDIIAQGALAAQAVDSLDFSTTAAEVGLWYPVTDGGENVYKISTLVLIPAGGGDALVEGEDFEVAPGLGMVRFYTAVNEELAVTVTAPEFAHTPLELMAAANAVKGLGIWQYFDLKYDGGESPALQTKPFGCLIDYNEALSITVEQNAEASLVVTTTSPKPQLIDYRV